MFDEFDDWISSLERIVEKKMKCELDEVVRYNNDQDVARDYWQNELSPREYYDDILCGRESHSEYDSLGADFELNEIM